MLCPSCNRFRPANNEACPFCHGPAPLVGDPRGAASNNYPPGQMPFSVSSWPDIPDALPPQLSFPSANQPPFAQPTGLSNGSLWTQVMAPNENPGASSRQQSLLPVPYQEQIAPGQRSLVPLPAGLSVNQGVNPLLPALPDSGEGAPVYVAPMYTKPRPLIPRYRAISGLISVIVVFALLCAGSAYYAQATGKLAGIQRMLGTYAPPSLAASQHTLAIPSIKVVDGPAANIVTSVALGDTIDKENGLVPNYVNQFNVNQTFWLSCSIHATKPGTISLSWFTNGNPWQKSVRSVTAANLQSTAAFPQVYPQPSEGKVEIYWNNKLAETLLFVVQPLA